MKPTLERGSIAHVRQRRYLIESVTKPSKSSDATLVDLSCLDDDAQGVPLKVLWEHELDAHVIESDGWSRVAEKGFDQPEVFTAYLRTLSWNCVKVTDPRLFQSPFRAGILIDAYQLAPLSKALELPRVNLFIADDVGLGKTIEAGLIARELLLRRRIDRIVVSCPPAMLEQWKEEMESRFGLSFVILDRMYLREMRQKRGFGVNPWTTHSYFLVSHRLLIDESYAAGLRDWLGEFSPQSLFILDEAHHAAPSSSSRSYAIDSQITRAIRDLSPRFEHRLFLSATPHNGHSNSFSALLEILDPQRFCRGVPVLKKHLSKVLIRRLKSDIRELAGGFPKREVVPIEIDGLPQDAPELVLPKLLNDYRIAREERLASEDKFQRIAGGLVIGCLQKRLLSSIEAFAKTLAVHRNTLEKSINESKELLKITKSDVDDLNKMMSGIEFEDEIDNIAEEAIQEEEQYEVGLHERIIQATSASTDARLVETQRALEQELLMVDEMIQIAQGIRHDKDKRIKFIIQWIETNMCAGLTTSSTPKWNERRLLIFTEYEDTRRWIERHLKEAISHSSHASRRIAVFSGATRREQRQEIKNSFNKEPADDPLRILIATDAAREGLNLQRHCYDLFHFDLPWNPNRLDQRNGRIDRKLQPADVVYCRYFRFKQRNEDRVLEVLMDKVERIRKELGSVTKILEERLTTEISREGIRHDNIDEFISEIQKISEDEKQKKVEEELEQARSHQMELKIESDKLRNRIEYSRKQIGLTEDKLRQALSMSLRLNEAPEIQPQKQDIGSPPSFLFPADHPSLANNTDWIATIDTLRERRKTGEKYGEWRQRAIIREITFEDTGKLGDKAVHLHLEHRVVKRLLGQFTAQGLIHHDLSKACLTVAAEAIPRVILLGRLAIYGPHASRLHEEIIPVTARWVDPSMRTSPIVPYQKSAEQTTLDSLERALDEAGRYAVSDQISDRLKASAKIDIDALLPYLESKAEELLHATKGRLNERAQREKRTMIELLENQKKRIAKASNEFDSKPQIGFNPEELRQLEADRRAWNKRLENIEDELKDEPNRIVETFSVKAHRVDPIGLVYLWPRTG